MEPKPAPPWPRSKSYAHAMRSSGGNLIPQLTGRTANSGVMSPATRVVGSPERRLCGERIWAKSIVGLMRPVSRSIWFMCERKSTKARSRGHPISML